AIAFSQVQRDWLHLDAAARKARELVQAMQQQQLVTAKPWLLNVNIPNRPYADIGALKLCRLGRRHAAEKVIQQTNPRGETMYWIGAAGAAADDAEGTDFHATLQGHMAMTPLQVDLTDHDQLGYWAQTAARLAPHRGRS
ncbi:MAG: 5'/3'-nucleotidase SurE, partial [Rhodoferax sp.]